MSAFQDALLQFRSAKKASSLRGETDHNKSAEMLSQILKEAIHLQGSGSKLYQKRALEELKQVRKDMVNQQINAGSATSTYIASYSRVIDSIEQFTEENKDSANGFSKGIDTIQKSMPSGDTLVSALMTANPMMGYGVKIMRDLSRARIESRKASVQKAQAEVKRLKALDEAARAEEVRNDKQEEILDTTQTEQKKAKREYKKRAGIYQPVLTEIRDRIGALEKFIKINTDIIEESEAELKLIEATEQASQDQIDAMKEIERERIRNEKLNRVDDSTTGGGSPVPNPIDSPENIPEAEKESLLSKIFGGALGAIGSALGSFTGILGAFAGGGVLTTLLSPFKAVLGFVMGIGKFALTIGKGLAMPALIITSLFNFFDGFFNAGKILGKLEGDTSIGERIGVGFANVFGEIVQAIDWLLGLFGQGGLIDSENMTKKIYDFFIGIPEAIGDFFDGIAASFNDGTLLTKVVGGIVKFYKTMGKTLLSFGKKFIGIYVDIYKNIFNYLSNVDWKGVLSETVEGFGNFFLSLFENFKMLLKEYLPDSVADMLFGTETNPTETSSTTGAPKYTGSPTPLIYPNSGSGSNMAGSAINRAEQSITNKSTTQVPMMINNAPTNTNVNNNNFGSSHTYNPNPWLKNFAGA